MAITELTDSELLQQVRDGQDAGFTELYMRHRAVARRIAATYRYPGDADDLVNEAFEKVYAALRRGSGPTGSFRAYLFVTMRHLAAERSERPAEELLDELPEPVAAARKAPALEAEERDLISQAYESLPDRSQAVLWYTAVEGRNPRDLSSRLGMTPNAVSALAYRAREQLRQAYLQAHLRTARPQCEPHRSGLGAYVRDGQSQRDRARTEEHVEHCPTCQGLVAELNEVNRLLVRAVAPVFLMGSVGRFLSAGAGSAAAAGAASGSGAGSAAGTGTGAGTAAAAGGAGAGAKAAAGAAHMALGGGSGLHRLPAALGWLKGAAGTAGGVAAAAAVLGGLAVTGSLLARDKADDDVAIVPASTGTSATTTSTTAGPATPLSGTEAAAAVDAVTQPCQPSAAADATAAPDAASTTPTDEPRSTTGLSAELPVLPESLIPALTESLENTSSLALQDPVCLLDAASNSGELTLSLADPGQSSTTATSAPLVDVDLAGVKLTVALTEGVLAVDAELPAGCEILDDGHTVQCTVDQALLGENTTLGLELLGDSDELATVTLERDGQTIDVRAVELLGDVTGSLTTGIAPPVDTTAAGPAGGGIEVPEGVVPGLGN